MSENKWSVGDVCWCAFGEINGNDRDLGVFAGYCKTRDEAESNAMEWFGDLTEHERERAETHVRKFEVLELDDDGSIGIAETHED